MKKRAGLFLIFIIMAVLLLSGCQATGKSASDSVPNGTMSSKTIENGSLQTPASTEPAKAAASGVDQPQEAGKTAKPTEPTEPTAADAGQSQAAGKTAEPAASAANQSPVSAQSPEALKNSVTISINCQTAVDRGLDKQEKFQGIVPPDGVILPPTQMEISDGETVFSVLKRVTREHKIQMEYEKSNGIYIQGINNLYELDGGPLSGWVYCVNNHYSSYNGDEYKLKNGDFVEWKYTCDLGKDLGQELFSLNN